LEDNVEIANPQEMWLRWTYYATDSLFLIVGIKRKTIVEQCTPKETFVYILKPLQNDASKKNIDKQLVWKNDWPYPEKEFDESFDIVND